MILFDNFKKIEDWPSYGFLYGDNILKKKIFDTLLAFDFNQCPVTDPTFPNRKALTTSNAQSIDKNLALTLHELETFSNNSNIIKSLITKSFQNSDMRLENFWTHGLKSIEELYKNVFIQFVEDEPNLFMAPHADHREVICNIQIYISPNCPEIGTRFYKTGDYSCFKTTPFVPNSGYFSLNTHLAIHGIHNTSNQKRKSIIISWTM